MRSVGVVNPANGYFASAFSSTSAGAQYGITQIQTSSPASASGATFVSVYGENTYSGVGGFTGAGHTIGGLFESITNAPSQTISLSIACEGALQHKDGTLTRGVGVLGSLNTLITGKTITTWEGVTSHANSTAAGTVGTYIGFNTDTSGASSLTVSGNYFGFYSTSPAATVSGVAYSFYSDPVVAGAASAIVGCTGNAAASRYGNYFSGTLQHVLGGKVRIGGATDPSATLDVTGTAAISGALSIGNTVQVAAAVASTHKITMSVGGATYYLLASNV